MLVCYVPLTHVDVCFSVSQAQGISGYQDRPNEGMNMTTYSLQIILCVILQNSALKKSGFSVKAKLPKHLSAEQKSKLSQYFTRVGWLG